MNIRTFEHLIYIYSVLVWPYLTAPSIIGKGSRDKRINDVDLCCLVTFGPPAITVRAPKRKHTPKP